MTEGTGESSVTMELLILVRAGITEAFFLSDLQSTTGVWGFVL